MGNSTNNWSWGNNNNSSTNNTSNSWGTNNQNMNNNNQQRVGTQGYKFKPHTDGNSKSNKKFYYQHICVGNNAFQSKSSEELRFEDQFGAAAAPGNDAQINGNTNNANNSNSGNDWAS